MKREKKQYSIAHIKIDKETKSKLYMIKYKYGFESMQELYQNIFDNGIVHFNNKRNKQRAKESVTSKTYDEEDKTIS